MGWKHRTETSFPVFPTAAMGLSRRRANKSLDTTTTNNNVTNTTATTTTTTTATSSRSNRFSTFFETVEKHPEYFIRSSQNASHQKPQRDFCQSVLELTRHLFALGKIF